MSDILAYTNGICRQLELRDRLAAGPITITASVGIGGVNRDPDVRTIQQALNDIPVKEGRPTPILVPDGICGPLTKNAVQQFQLKHFGWKGADGRVDPDKQTIAKLNELRAGRLPELQGIELRIPRMAALLNEAFSCIRAAQMNLLSALRVVDTPNESSSFPTAAFSRAERMKKVNRHFDIDGYPTGQRSGVLRRILGIFDRMLKVFAHPGGLWGTAAFDIDPMERKARAYVYPGGFDLQGELYTPPKGITIRKDAIYFCNSMDEEPDEQCVTIIIHELAHFCGGESGTTGHIDDYVDPAWFDHQTMRSMPRERRLKHAMCYNNFAWDSKHSRKPAGLK